MTKAELTSDGDIARRLVEARSPEAAVETTLRTSDRVLARVTDGIYRQPGSAIRELLANAYDADATTVRVFTDRPRFGTIRVEDNGRGMSPEVLEYVLGNIGGSSKRVAAGKQLRVTHLHDPDLSPGGRRLIGKIGIGLFSVSQLTRSFQIITKQKGDTSYSIAQFLLKHYADEGIEETDDRYEAGIARLWQEETTNTAYQGTTVVLTDVRPEAVANLRSEEMWRLVDAQGGKRHKPPTYHIGRTRQDSDDHIRIDDEGHAAQALPWGDEEDPAHAFSTFVGKVEETASRSNDNTKLDGICDQYLRMVWDLALALPLPYVGKDPLFDPPSEGVACFRLDGGASSSLELGGDGSAESVGDALGLAEPMDAVGGFAVHVDELQLARPLTFERFPPTKRTRQDPLLFGARVSESFEGADPQLSGGPLEFHAYLVWAPKLAPADRAGALVRIHGASGSGFDSRFLRYQVQETTRIAQTTCEIFVTRGLEGALHIDRESFNYAHPHVVYLSKWVHRALTSLFTTEKHLSSEATKTKRTAQKQHHQDRLDALVDRVWTEEVGEEEEPPTIVINTDPSASATPLSSDSYEISVLADDGDQASGGGPDVPDEVTTVLQILAAFRLIDELDVATRERLARALIEVIKETKSGG